MKNILIVANDLEIGGAERALIGLLDTFDPQLVNIDLFLFHHRGPFMKLIPEHINLLPEIPLYTDLAIPIKTVLKRGHIEIALRRIYGKLRARMFLTRNKSKGPNSVEVLYSYKYTYSCLPTISNKIYDLVLGFTVPYYVVDKKTNGICKAVWIHTDYSKEFSDEKEELKAWEKADYIVSISDLVSKTFLSKYPSLRKKVRLIENISSKRMILSQADEFDVEKEMPINQKSSILLSVGRFVHAKNFDNIPEICSRIINNGYQVKWYIIGYGPDENLIRDKIRLFHMEQNVIILGKKENPYPYIKRCDLYVQPSRFEGKCVSVIEAQMMGKPVVITNYSTAKSQLEENVDGVIVPLDNEGCAIGIVELLSNQVLLEKLACNCRRRDYTNRNEIVKLYDILNI